MKRTAPWISIGIVAAIVGLLTVFMALLYNWQQAASVAEKEQLQRRVEADAKAFADQFNREIQGTFFNFQVDPVRVENGDASEIAERFDYWKKNSAYADLIKEMIAFTGDHEPRRFDETTQSFVSITADETVERLRKQLASEPRTGPIMGGGYTLAVPLHAAEEKLQKIVIRRKVEATEIPMDLPKPNGHIVVFLNESVIREKMLPDLAAKHFPNGDFNVGVTDRGGQTIYGTMPIGETNDAKEPLFDLTPDQLIWIANRQAMPRTVTEGDSHMVLDQRIESRTITQGDAAKVEAGQTFTVQMKETGTNRRTTVFNGDPRADSPWQLGVQHSAGSIDAFIQNELNRNLAIGFGIYLLLLGGIISIVYSSLRAKAFAQRQIDFVSSVSHEFRTPLAVIYSAGENLADGVARDGDQVSKYGNLIKGEGKKLSSMVEQILEFAGARSGNRKYNLADGDVSAAVEKALIDSEQLLKVGGFEVESDLSKSLPSTSIDRDAIETAVRNLIQNAVKYSNGSRWLRVSTMNGNGSIKIVVEDGGIGILPADRKKIFEPFYRAKDVVDAQIHGNGLGLSLVKEIVEAHRGKVSVESKKGNGSRFVIDLPQS